jgi:hypothetical protein
MGADVKSTASATTPARRPRRLWLWFSVGFLLVFCRDAPAGAHDCDARFRSVRGSVTAVAVLRRGHSPAVRAYLTRPNERGRFGSPGEVLPVQYHKCAWRSRK